MKPFSKIINEGSKKEKAFISFYQFNNRICKDNIPITSICSENYFYDDDGHIENKLAEKEGIWSHSIKRVNCGMDITAAWIGNGRSVSVGRK